MLSLRAAFPVIFVNIARELFVSVRFVVLPGIRAYVVHRRERGSPVCMVVEVTNECSALAAEVED